MIEHLPTELNEQLVTPGMRVRWLRMARDLKQSALADACNVGQTAISQIERDLWIPRPPIRKAIAAALGAAESVIWRPDDLVRMRRRVA